jgi:hypothetical protein
MLYKEDEIVTIPGIPETKFKVVMFSEKSRNLMLNKCGTPELWSAHADDVLKSDEPVVQQSI